jgi:hypothetical protein
MESIPDALRRIRLEDLDPQLQREIRDFADSMGHEMTVRERGDLRFILKLYQQEKRKGHADRRRLEEAENIIMKLSSFRSQTLRREAVRRKEEQSKRARFRVMDGALTYSKRAEELLNSIGITDRNVIQQAEELLGDSGIEERVDLVKSVDIPQDILLRLFSEFQQLILIPNDEDFVYELEAIETKRDIIDTWSGANMVPPPVWADYGRTPGILLDDYHDISRLLGLEEPEVEEGPELMVEYRGKPMDPEDFMKVVLAMGFSRIREAKHGTLIRRGDFVMCVQKAHRKQMQLNPSTQKKKLQESGVDLNEFERKRRELRL